MHSNYVSLPNYFISPWFFFIKTIGIVDVWEISVKSNREIQNPRNYDPLVTNTKHQRHLTLLDAEISNTNLLQPSTPRFTCGSYYLRGVGTSNSTLANNQCNAVNKRQFFFS